MATFAPQDLDRIDWSIFQNATHSAESMNIRRAASTDVAQALCPRGIE
jgi:hypothetical protein